MAAILVAAWGANTAYADEAAASLSIAPSGQVILKNARVVAVAGPNISVEAFWGMARISAVIQTTGSTRFVPDMASADALAALTPGQTVSVTGTLSGSFERPTVIASVVKNGDLVRSSVSILGTVAESGGDPNSFVLHVQGSPDVTVFVPTGALMSKDGNYADVDDIQPGDSVRATGTLETSTNSLTANRVSVASRAESDLEPEPETVSEGPGVISSILSWIRGTRGILSVRDR